MGFYPNRKEVFILLQLLFILGLGDTKLCIIKKQPDPNEHFHMRWVLPYVKEILCTCTKVEYETASSLQTCTGKYYIPMPLAKDYFYTDDPKPFVESKTADKLRMSFECDKYTGWQTNGEYCYYARANAFKTYDEARDACLAQNATLTSVVSREEQDFLAELVIDFDVNLWIGLNQRTKEGNWTWEDETQFGFENWSDNQPSGNENCVHLSKNDVRFRSWNDIRCSGRNQVSGYICKIRQPGAGCHTLNQ